MRSRPFDVHHHRRGHARALDTRVFPRDAAPRGVDARRRLSLVRFNGLDPRRRRAAGEMVPRTVPREQKLRPRRAGRTHRRAGDARGENLSAREPRPARSASAVGALTENPRRFAQLLVLDRSRERVLLGKHRAGEFEGMYTGFIAEVFGRKTPRDAAVDALERGGLRLGREEGFVSSGEERYGARRFRFAGWLDVPVVEHEFTLRLLGDGVTLEERFPPRVHDGDADEGTRETFDPRIDAVRVGSRRRDPDDEMPSDDRAGTRRFWGWRWTTRRITTRWIAVAFDGERWRSATSSSAITASCGNTAWVPPRRTRTGGRARSERKGRLIVEGIYADE